MGNRSQARLPIHPRSPAQAIAKTECPLCGASNECAAVTGEAHCWCFDVSIAPEVLRRIPTAAKGVACICPSCAADSATGAPLGARG